jgi:hypothetical protein
MPTHKTKSMLCFTQFELPTHQQNLVKGGCCSGGDEPPKIDEIAPDTGG